jgi:hypothetical protein
MIRRREFIAGLGSAAGLPLAAKGQQRQVIPVIEDCCGAGAAGVYAGDRVSQRGFGKGESFHRRISKGPR